MGEAFLKKPLPHPPQKILELFCQNLLQEGSDTSKSFYRMIRITERECFAPFLSFWVKISDFKEQFFRRAPCVALLLPRARGHLQDPARSESCLQMERGMCVFIYLFALTSNTIEKQSLRLVPRHGRLSSKCNTKKCFKRRFPPQAFFRS